MILIANYNKQNKKFMPYTSIQAGVEEVRESAKKQVIDEILNHPDGLVAYKKLELWKIGEIDGNLKITNTEHEKICDYAELLDEIVETLTNNKEQSENGKKDTI